MDEITGKHFENLRSGDRDLRYQSFLALLAATEEPVDWAYEVWDELVANLGHKDNHVRAIAAQLLANLAKSDPYERMLKDFDALLAVTRNPRFVTARHCLQSIWKVGAAGISQREILIDGLSGRFFECASEKNCTLVRFDIVQGLKHLFDATGDAQVRETAQALIGMETDEKYRRKYAGLWRGSL